MKTINGFEDTYGDQDRKFTENSIRIFEIVAF